MPALTEQPPGIESLRGTIVGLSLQGIEALRAVASGGPEAWRVVQDTLAGLLRAGEEFGALEEVSPPAREGAA